MPKRLVNYNNHMSKEEPVLSPFGYENLFKEVEKIQGKNPALILLFDGRNELITLRHYVDLGGKVGNEMIKALVIQALDEKGMKIPDSRKYNLEIKVVKKEVDH